MPFDFNALLEDPQFQAGIGIMGGARNGGGLTQAYQILNQQRMQKMKMEEEASQRAMEKEKIQLYRQQVEQSAANTALKQRELEQSQAQFDMGMKLVRQLKPELADQVQPFLPTPNGPMPGPVNPQAASAAVETDKYGIPKSIIRNLIQTESGGNPNAIGPPIPGSSERAIGLGQFLPSTVKMLAAGGYNFDPTDGKQSEDAIGYYLSKLLKENDGDWNKTLAAYGGFKAKDPTQYISKIMAGSPEQQAATHVENSSLMQRVAQLRAQAEAARRDQAAAGAIRFAFGDKGGISEIAKSGVPNLDVEQFGLAAQKFGLDERQFVQTQARDAETKRSNLTREGISRDEENRKAKKQTQELDAEMAKGNAGYRALVQGNDVLRTTIERLKNDPNLGNVTGRMGLMKPELIVALNPKWGNTVSDIEQVTGSRINAILQGIRQASLNGAAGFGQFQKFEHDMLSDIDSLKRTRTAEEFKKKLTEVETKLTTFEESVAASYRDSFKREPNSVYEGLPPGSRYVGTDPESGRPLYRQPDGRIKIRKN